MSRNKKFGMVIMILIVLTLLSTTVAAGIMDSINNLTGSVTGLFGGYKFVIVNTLILSALLITILALYPGLENREKQRQILQFIAVAAAFLISWQMYPNDYLWHLKNVSEVLHLKIWINVLVIAAFFFILINLPKIGDKIPKEGVAKWAIYIAILVIAFLIAINPLKVTDTTKENYGEIEWKEGYGYIWERENLMKYRFMFLGDSKCYAFDSYGFKEEKYVDKYGNKYYYDTREKLRQKKTFFKDSFADESIKGNLTRVGKFIGSDGNKYIYEDGVVKKDGLFRNKEIAGEKQKQLQNDVENAVLYGKIKGNEISLIDIESKDKTKANELRNIADSLNEKEKGGRYCYTEQSKEAVKQDRYDEMEDYVAYENKKPRIQGFGILRGKHLFIFVFGTILLIWLFNNLLGKENQYINYLISILLAGNAAHSGLGWRAFLIGAEIITWYMLYRGISKGEGASERKWVNAVIAAGLAHLIFKTAFPASHVPLPLVEDWGPLAWGLATVPFLLFGAVIGKRDDKEKKGLSRLWEAERGPLRAITDLLTLGGTGLFKLARKIPWVKKLVIDTFGLGYFTNKGEVLKSFRELFYMFGVHMNWQLRLEVFTAKHTAVKLTKEHVKPYSERLGKDFSANRYVDHMRWYKTGNRITTDKEGKKGYETRENFRKELKQRQREKLISKKRFEKLMESVKDPLYTPKDVVFTTKDLPNPGDTSIEVVKYINTRYFDEHEGTVNRVQKFPVGCLTHYDLVVRAMQAYAGNVSSKKKMTSSIVRAEKLVGDYANENIIPSFDEIEKNIESNRESYDSYYKRYSYTRLLRYHEKAMFDQYLVYGNVGYKHSYWFARPDAEIEYCDYDIKVNSKNNYEIDIKDEKCISGEKVSEDIPKKYVNYPYEYKKDGKEKTDYTKAGYKTREMEKVEEEGEIEEIPIYFMYEVWYQNGWFLDDENFIMNFLRTESGSFDEKKTRLKGKKRYIRRVKDVWLLGNPREIDNTTIVRFGNFYKAMRWLEMEWDNWVEDMRDGRYSPRSRTASDYREAYDEDKDYEFKKPIEPTGVVGPDRPAFDMEALKDPKMYYWGREHYDDENKLKLKEKHPLNPYPALSTRGLSIFLAEHIGRLEHDTKKAQEFLKYFTRDIGEDRIEGEQKKVFGKLSEEQPEEEE